MKRFIAKLSSGIVFSVIVVVTASAAAMGNNDGIFPW